MPRRTDLERDLCRAIIRPQLRPIVRTKAAVRPSEWQDLETAFQRFWHANRIDLDVPARPSLDTGLARVARKAAASKRGSETANPPLLDSGLETLRRDPLPVSKAKGDRVVVPMIDRGLSRRLRPALVFKASAPEPRPEPLQVALKRIEDTSAAIRRGFEHLATLVAGSKASQAARPAAPKAPRGLPTAIVEKSGRAFPERIVSPPR